jgi:two-component system, cell cycle response regulator DivK
MVLVIDDDRAVCAMVRSVLERTGIRVRTAQTASEGIGIARKERPGLILIDVHLPGIDGVAALRVLRADPVFRAVPIVVICGYPEEVIRESLDASGAVGLLEKPFSAGMLRDAVGTWMV